ncbi:MAG: hypothetical protein JJE25_05605 [Bacteroidia bacterium]|nr:hypothetical protein [Bacteroidia bacterium]
MSRNSSARALQSSGQLGDGTNITRYTPIQVSSLSGIVAIAAGGLHSLFVKYDSTAWACGNNVEGEVGDSSTSVFYQYTPVQVYGLTSIAAVAAGAYHSLFLKSDGTVWACGWNLYGELGDGTTSQRIAPVQVSSLTGIIAIAAGDFHSRFLKNDGTVWACGYNNHGQLGDGTTTDRWTPIQITGLCQIPTAIAEQQQENAFQIYPNPVTSELRMEKAELKVLRFGMWWERNA